VFRLIYTVYPLAVYLVAGVVTFNGISQSVLHLIILKIML